MSDLFYFLRKNPVELSRYLPPFLSKDESFKEILDVHSREHENLRVKLVDLAKQFFIETATYSMSDWEEFVGVTKITDDLEARRARVKAKLLGSDVMTVENVNRLIRTFTDGDLSYVEEMNVPNQIKFILLDRVLYWREMAESLRELMPAHLGLNFERQIKTVTKITVGNAFGRMGYKEIGLSKIPHGLTRLHAGVAIARSGYRDIATLTPPPILYGNKIVKHAGLVTLKSGMKIIGCDLRDLNRRTETRLKETAISDLLIVDVGIARPQSTNKEPETDDDDYPGDGEWLRLYFDYPTGQDHPVLLINPRGDLVVNDVKKVGNLAREHKIFLNSKAESTLGIHQADLIKGYTLSKADDVQIIPSTGVLRLFFNFPSGNKRKILLYNIRGGLTIGEIKELGKCAVENRLLINCRGEPVTNLSHAAVIKRFDMSDADEPIAF